VGTELSIPVEIPVCQPPATDGPVLGVVYRAILAQLIKKAGFSRKNAQTGAVTLIQRFGSALIKSPGAIVKQPQAGPAGVEGRMPGITSMFIFMAHIPCAPPAVVQIGYPTWWGIA
jgi:hypothetical protein